jgi:hypothetical protein
MENDQEQRLHQCGGFSGTWIAAMHLRPTKWSTDTFFLLATLAISASSLWRILGSVPFICSYRRGTRSRHLHPSWFDFLNTSASPIISISFYLFDISFTTSRTSQLRPMPVEAHQNSQVDAATELDLESWENPNITIHSGEPVDITLSVLLKTIIGERSRVKAKSPKCVNVQPFIWGEVCRRQCQIDVCLT